MRRLSRIETSAIRWLLLALALSWLLSSTTAQESDAPAADDAPAAVDGPPTGDEATGDEATGDPPSPTPARRKVVVGHIDGEITLAQSAYVRRLLEEARLRKADVVAIELNTFGGRLDAAVAIRDLLLDASPTTVIFINRRAISAGALISLACEKIAITSGATIGAATPVQQTPGQETAQPVEEKYVSYFREEMRVTAETRGRNGDIAEAMVDADKEVPGVSEEGKLLTLNTRTALEHGIADVEAESLDDALAQLGLGGETATIGRTWSETLVAFLTSAAISSLLFFAMMFLAYLEYQTPGFGGFGAGALFCFLLLYFGHYMVNLAGWEELILFVIGVVLIVIEIFAFPGFGVIGVLGVLSIAASLVMLLMAGDWSDLTFDNPFTTRALLRVTLSVMASLFAMVLLIRWLPKSGSTVLGGRLVLTEDLETQAGFSSHETADATLVGKTGEALTALRPAGKARIGEKRWNVETEGDYVEAGDLVRVLRQEPGRIVVRRA